MAEYEKGLPNPKRRWDEEEKHPIEVVGMEIREMFKGK